MITIFNEIRYAMIVCVCNNVSDRKIRQAVDTGSRSLVDLRRELDVGTCCGKCHSCAKQVLRTCLDEKQEREAEMLFPALAA